MNAETVISRIDSALGSINQQRAKIGVAQQKLENVISSIQTQLLAYEQAISAVIDGDYAEDGKSYEISNHATSNNRCDRTNEISSTIYHYLAQLNLVVLDIEHPESNLCNLFK